MCMCVGEYFPDMFCLFIVYSYSTQGLIQTSQFGPSQDIASYLLPNYLID